ncbi:MAG: transposase [archaeon]
MAKNLEHWTKEPLGDNDLYQLATKSILRALEGLDSYSRRKVLQEFNAQAIANKIKEKKKHSQDWSAYNQAQSQEKIILIQVLNELLENIDFPEVKKVGRNPIPLKDKIFYVVLQAYNGKSSRRCIADLELCRRLDYIKKTPHFNTVLQALKDPEVITVLKHLIEVSGLPLRHVEQDFAVDSSGFSTSQFDRWQSAKYGGGEGDVRRFRKAHVTSGVNTNIITAVTITKGHSGDSPEFGGLVKTTSRIYDIREMSADKAYSSRKNLQIVSDAGGIPFIPFKKNTRGNLKGKSIWRSMYDFYTLNQDEFLKHYHKRSNAETVFHMLKIKFGSSLRTKNEVSQDNEILAKCLAHNLCVLIQELFEIGIEVNFNKCAKIPVQRRS